MTRMHAALETPSEAKRTPRTLRWTMVDPPVAFSELKSTDAWLQGLTGQGQAVKKERNMFRHPFVWQALGE